MLRIKTKDIVDDILKPYYKVGIIDVACCGLRHTYKCKGRKTGKTSVGIIDVACCGLRPIIAAFLLFAAINVGIIDVACCGLRPQTHLEDQQTS